MRKAASQLGPGASSDRSVRRAIVGLVVAGLLAFVAAGVLFYVLYTVDQAANTLRIEQQQQVLAVERMRTALEQEVVCGEGYLFNGSGSDLYRVYSARTDFSRDRAELAKSLQALPERQILESAARVAEEQQRAVDDVLRSPQPGRSGAILREMPLHLEAVQRIEELRVSLEYRNKLARAASLANSARVRTLVLIIGPAILLTLGAVFPYLMLGALLRARHREREEADRARRATSLVGIAAHELRNHLHSLLLNVENILARAKRDSGGANLGEGALQRLREQATRLSHLLGGLLDVAQLSSDQIRLEFVSLDLGAVARETISRHQDDIAISGSTVTLTIESPAIGLWDQVRVEQIVTNLLSNAIKYGRGNPIEVSIGTAGESAWLSVRDHGIGISPADQSRIFQQYERAIGAHQIRGTGLGLWVCQRLVAAMQGEIRLWSELGNGSQFTVTLPLHPPDARALSTSVGHIGESVPS